MVVGSTGFICMTSACCMTLHMAGSAVRRCCKKNGLKNIATKRICNTTSVQQRNKRKGGKFAGDPNVHTAMEENLLSLAVETS